MRVLLLTQVLPYPPDSGPKVKTFNLIKYLTQQHEITIASFVRGDKSAEIRELNRYCKAVYTIPIARSIIADSYALIKSMTTNQPWIILRDNRDSMHQLVDKLTKNNHFDIIHVDQLNMAQFAERIKGTPKVLDAHNALWLLYKRLANTMAHGPQKWILNRDWPLLKQYEGDICNQFEAVTAVSDEDKIALQEAAGHNKDITVINISVDLDEMPLIERSDQADHVLHFGTMYWPPNIDGITWFLNEILPIVQQNRASTIIDLVGARPPQSIISRAQIEPHVNVTGYVADLTPYLEMAGVFIVPLRAGGGMRVKILEALARGLPLVTTTVGCEGIAVEHERHVLIANTPEEFANAIIRLLNDQNFAKQLGLAGRHLIETTYDYHSACKPLDKVYKI